MEKPLLLSILIMMIYLPIRAARHPNARLGLRKAVVSFFSFNAFYWVAVVFLYFYLYLGRSPAELLSRTVHD